MFVIDDPSVLQWFVGQAGIGGLAGFALFMLGGAYQTALQREREYAEANRDDKKLLISVLNENTAAITKMASAVDNLQRQTGSRHD